MSKVVKSYLDSAKNSNTSTSTTDTSTIYFKLQVLNISNFTKCKVLLLAKRYCKSLNIRLAFSSIKIKNLITVKAGVPRFAPLFLVYRFTCAGCSSVYVA